MTNAPKDAISLAVASAVTNQHAPRMRADSVDVVREIVADLRTATASSELIIAEQLEARRLLGIRKYAAPLHTFNGRNALDDLQQELLDALVYGAQYCIEQRASELKAVASNGAAPRNKREALLVILNNVVATCVEESHKSLRRINHLRYELSKL